MKRCVSVLFVFCILLAVFSGCQTSEPVKADTGEITVVFIPKLTGSAFFDVANEGAQVYSQNRGFLVDYCGSPNPDVNDQIGIVRDAINRKVGAICISSLDTKSLDPVLKEAMAAGIKVTTWDSDVSGDARTVMVSQGTPSQLGQMLVEMGAKSLSSRGKDPTREVIYYAWHYSQSLVADQNSWWAAGEKYISETYPNWVNVEEKNYYSEQNADKAKSVGRSILTEHPNIDLIICNDSTALPGQAQAAREMGLGAKDVSITGFAPPSAMYEYCMDGTVERWGLWDCKLQGALGCYIAYYLASGNKLTVGDRINVPEIGLLEIMPNTVLDPNAYTAEDSGVILLPSRVEFTIDNVDQYNF